MYVLFCWITVAIAAIITDILWVVYIRRTGQGQSFYASLSATGILLCQGYVMINFVKNPLLLIPAAIATFLTTYFAIKWDEKNPRKSNA